MMGRVLRVTAVGFAIAMALIALGHAVSWLFG